MENFIDGTNSLLLCLFLYFIYLFFKEAFGSLSPWNSGARHFRAGLGNLCVVALVAVKTEEGLTQFFRVTREVLQGDSFSPLALAFSHWYVRNRGLGGINIDMRNIIMLLFVDDFRLFGDSKRIENQTQYEFSESMRLTPNPGKTKVVCFSKRAVLRVNGKYQVRDTFIEGTSEYTWD